MPTASRHLHRMLGIVLLLPMLGWAATGVVFFTKPGYTAAYEQLQPRLYPVESLVAPPTSGDWQEVRLLRTVLGDHLLVRKEGGLRQLDPVTLSARGLPGREEITTLVADAIAGRPRYGEITHVDGNTITTSTGVEITLDWDQMRLSQRGRDTRLIAGLYRLHYLQWTGMETLDRVLGIAGLVLLATLTLFGLRLSIRSDA